MQDAVYIDRVRLEKPHLKNFKKTTFIFKKIKVSCRDLLEKQKFPLTPRKYENMFKTGTHTHTHSEENGLKRERERVGKITTNSP